MKSLKFDVLNRKKYRSLDVKTYKFFFVNDDFWDADYIIKNIYPNMNKIYNSCSFTAYNKNVLNKFHISSKCFKQLAGFGKLPGVKHKSW